MKLTITPENFRKGLAAVTASIPTRTTLPVLSNILLEAEEGGVRMSGTDLDIAVSLRVPAEVEDEGALTVPARKLQDLAKELPDQPARIETSGERFELTCGKADFRLNGMSPDEFPTFPTVDFEQSWTFEAEMLQRLIAQTRFAASTEESRPILNGVLWQLGEERMQMVATNGHRLAKISVAAETDGVPATDLIVPPAALEHVENLFDSDARVEVARSENHLGFREGGTRVFTRLIEGPYPNYEQVIPKDNDKIAVCDKAQLERVLRRMAVVASEQTRRVRLSFNGPVVRFAVETPDVGEAHEELEVDYRGEALDIGFNASYLLEVLGYIPGDEVRIALKAPERAATLEPVATDEGEEAPDYLCLIMPLRLLE